MGKEDLSLSLSLGFAQTHHPLKLNLNPTSSSISNLQMFPWNQTFVSSSGTASSRSWPFFQDTNRSRNNTFPFLQIIKTNSSLRKSTWTACRRRFIWRRRRDFLPQTARSLAPWAARGEAREKEHQVVLEMTSTSLWIDLPHVEPPTKKKNTVERLVGRSLDYPKINLLFSKTLSRSTIL